MNIKILIEDSILNKSLQHSLEWNSALRGDPDILLQLLVNDGCLGYPEYDILEEYDQSEEMFDFLNNVCQNCQHKVAKDFIINLGRMGFDNLQFKLVCEWHMAFSKFEIQKFQGAARNLMTLMS